MLLDWRDADRSWYPEMDESAPGGNFDDNAQNVVADDGSWICTWATGTRETSKVVQIV